MARAGILIVLAGVAAALILACQTEQSHQGGESEPAAIPPAAPWPEGPTVAVDNVDAPGFNVEDLTRRLAAAVAHTSGTPVVSKMSVRDELAACVTLPCATVEQERFQKASMLVHATVSRVGEIHLVTVRLQEGLRDVVRVTRQGRDPRLAVDQAGQEIGARLRAERLHPVTSTDSGGAAPAPLEAQ